MHFDRYYLFKRKDGTVTSFKVDGFIKQKQYSPEHMHRAQFVYQLEPAGPYTNLSLKP